jgi:class 3 adenylate cyclase/CHASE2 domain-containing sensor protein
MRARAKALALWVRRSPAANSVFAAAVACGLVWFSGSVSEKNAVLQSRLGAAAGANASGQYDLLHKLELVFFDWRARAAAKADSTISPQIALLEFDDQTVKRFRSGFPLGEPYGLLFPRHLYARALRELTAQGVQGVAFDVTLQDERPDHGLVDWVKDGVTNRIGSDQALEEALRASGRTALGADMESPPALPFRQAALAVGSVDSPPDVDGVSRRVFAYLDARFYSAPLLSYARKHGCYIEPGGDPSQIKLADYGSDTNRFFPIAADGTVAVPVGTGRVALPVFETRRTWHLGIILAAMELGLDLEHSETRPGAILLRSTNHPGLAPRIIHVDVANSFPVDWSIPSTRIPSQKFEDLIASDELRQQGEPDPGAVFWKGKLAVVGSAANGNNLTDHGATPLGPSDFLVATYANVANSVLKNRFIRKPSLAVEMAITLAAAMISGWTTWKIRGGAAGAVVLTLASIYAAFAFWMFLRHRVWLPLAHPIIAGMLFNHAAVLSWRVLFEQSERQRVRSVFSKIVAPEVVHELLRAESVGLSGARRRLTVFFADVRGFTEMTDRFQADAESHVAATGLTGASAEAHFEVKAGEVLATVNLYLGTLAEIVKSHQGTLDKYIGDCVMAFWGAPTADDEHAVKAVKAAIDAQRAIERLNRERAAENERRRIAGVGEASGATPLPLLQLGTGVNSGFMTVGLMGSDAHIVNYTVFGREVNLASRLEGVSGRGRIIIGEGTYADLCRFAPDLAATCQSLPPVAVKGFRQPVQVYEVPWRESGSAEN